MLAALLLAPTTVTAAAQAPKATVLRGFVTGLHPVRRPEPQWISFETLTLTRSSVWGAFPARPQPLADCDVTLGVAVCRLDDPAVFAEAMAWMRRREAIRRRIADGTHEISLDAFKQYLRFRRLRPKAEACARYLVGSKPDWRTTTNADGEYAFTLEHRPGRDGAIFVQAMTFAHPPAGREGPFMTEPHSPNTWYHPGYSDAARGLNLRAASPSLEPFSDDRLTEAEALANRFTADADAADALRDEIAKTEEAFEAKRAALEPRWQDRALADQRALEAEYIRRHGPATGWKDAVRRQFEQELAAQPEKSRRGWEQDIADLEAAREAALAPLRERLAGREAALGRARTALRRIDAEVRARVREQAADGYDIVNTLPGREAGWVYAVEEAGTFSGRRITPKLKLGHATAVFLVKQTVDGEAPPCKNPYIGVQGFYAGDGRASVFVDLDRDVEGQPVPPFVFDLEAPLQNHRLVYQFSRDPRPEAGRRTYAAGPVRRVFGGAGLLKTRINNCLNRVWMVNGLPPAAVVEGHPPKDPHRWQRLLTERRILEARIRRIDRDLVACGRDFRAGRLDYPQAEKAYKACYERLREAHDASRRNVADLKALNPAFDPAVQAKLLPD